MNKSIKRIFAFAKTKTVNANQTKTTMIFQVYRKRLPFSDNWILSLSAYSAPSRICKVGMYNCGTEINNLRSVPSKKNHPNPNQNASANPINQKEDRKTINFICCRVDREVIITFLILTFYIELVSNLRAREQSHLVCKSAILELNSL